MRETGTKICAINIELLLSGQVDIDTARAIDFDSRSGKLLRNTDRKHVLALAEDAWACAKRTLQKLLSHLVEAVRGQDVSGMNHPIKIHG